MMTPREVSSIRIDSELSTPVVGTISELSISHPWRQLMKSAAMRAVSSAEG